MTFFTKFIPSEVLDFLESGTNSSDSDFLLFAFNSELSSSIFCLKFESSCFARTNEGDIERGTATPSGDRVLAPPGEIIFR